MTWAVFIDYLILKTLIIFIVVVEVAWLLHKQAAGYKALQVSRIHQRPLHAWVGNVLQLNVGKLQDAHRQYNSSAPSRECTQPPRVGPPCILEHIPIPQRTPHRCRVLAYVQGYMEDPLWVAEY